MSTIQENEIPLGSSVPVGQTWVVRKIFACNTGSGDRSFTLTRTRDSVVATLYSSAVVSEQDTATIEGPINLVAGDILAATASDGLEVTAFGLIISE